MKYYKIAVMNASILKINRKTVIGRLFIPTIMPSWHIIKVMQHIANLLCTHFGTLRVSIPLIFQIMIEFRVIAATLTSVNSVCSMFLAVRRSFEPA